MPHTPPVETVQTLLKQQGVDKAKQLMFMKKIGEGAFATVELHQAQATSLARQPRAPPSPTQQQGTVLVAVKQYKRHVLQDETVCKFLLNEAKLLHKLDHQHIIRALGVGCQDDSSPQSMATTFFLVEEYAPGKHVRSLVTRAMIKIDKLVYSKRDAVRWAIQLASALAYLHNLVPMVIHRDVKLENILLTSENPRQADVVLADFGLAVQLPGAAIQESSQHGPNNARRSEKEMSWTRYLGLGPDGQRGGSLRGGRAIMDVLTDSIRLFGSKNNHDGNKEDPKEDRHLAHTTSPPPGLHTASKPHAQDVSHKADSSHRSFSAPGAHLQSPLQPSSSGGAVQLTDVSKVSKVPQTLSNDSATAGNTSSALKEPLLAHTNGPTPTSAPSDSSSSLAAAAAAGGVTQPSHTSTGMGQAPGHIASGQSGTSKAPLATPFMSHPGPVGLPAPSAAPGQGGIPALQVSAGRAAATAREHADVSSPAAETSTSPTSATAAGTSMLARLQFVTLPVLPVGLPEVEPEVVQGIQGAAPLPTTFEDAPIDSTTTVGQDMSLYDNLRAGSVGEGSGSRHRQLGGRASLQHATLSPLSPPGLTGAALPAQAASSGGAGPPPVVAQRAAVGPHAENGTWHAGTAFAATLRRLSFMPASKPSLKPSGAHQIGGDKNQTYDLTRGTGSLMYMAPEVFKGQPYNQKADVFSWSMVFYELLHVQLLLTGVLRTGSQRPEVAVHEYAAAVAAGFRPPLHTKLPVPLMNLLTRCWAANPLERPSMTQVVSMLTQYLDDHGEELDAWDAATFATCSCCAIS